MCGPGCGWFVLALFVLWAIWVVTGDEGADVE